MSDPGIEWIEGDRIWSRAFTALNVAVLAAVVILGPLLLWNTLSDFGVISSTPASLAGGWWSLSILAFVSITLASLFVPLYRPVARRVGVSQTGLVLKYPLRTWTIPWSQALWISPTRVTLRRMGAGTFLLTQYQSKRIYHAPHPV